MTWTNLVGAQEELNQRELTKNFPLTENHLLLHSLHLHRAYFLRWVILSPFFFGGFSDRWKSWSWYIIHGWKCSAWQRFASLSQHRTFRWWCRMLEVSSWKQCFCMVFEVFEVMLCASFSTIAWQCSTDLIYASSFPWLDTYFRFVFVLLLLCLFIHVVDHSVYALFSLILHENCGCTFFYFQWR